MLRALSWIELKYMKTVLQHRITALLQSHWHEANELQYKDEDQHDAGDANANSMIQTPTGLDKALRRNSNHM